MRRNPASAPAPHCSAELRPDAAFLLCRPPETSRPFPAVSRASFGNPAPERPAGSLTESPAGSLTEGLRKKCINHLRPCRLPRTDVFPFFPRVTTSPRHHATTPRLPDTPPSAIPAFSPLSPSIFPFLVRPRLRLRVGPVPLPSSVPHNSPIDPPSPASVRNPPEMRNLSAPPLDTGRRYIKTYRNSQGGVQVPTGGEPPCAGQPAGAFSREKRRSGASPGPTVTVRKKENGFLASVF